MLARTARAAGGHPGSWTGANGRSQGCCSLFMSHQDLRPPALPINILVRMTWVTGAPGYGNQWLCISRRQSQLWNKRNGVTDKKKKQHPMAPIRIGAHRFWLTWPIWNGNKKIKKQIKHKWKVTRLRHLVQGCPRAICFNFFLVTANASISARSILLARVSNGIAIHFAVLRFVLFQ